MVRSTRRPVTPLVAADSLELFLVTFLHDDRQRFDNVTTVAASRDFRREA